MKYYKVDDYGETRIYRNNPDLHFVELMFWSVYNNRDRVWVDSTNPHIFAYHIEEITEQEAFIEII